MKTAETNIIHGKSKPRTSRLRENHQGQGLLHFLIMTHI